MITINEVKELVKKFKGFDIAHISLNMQLVNDEFVLTGFPNEISIAFRLENECGFGADIADKLSQDYGRANIAVYKSLRDMSSFFNAVINLENKTVKVNANELMFALERNTLKMKKWDHNKTMKVINDIQLKMAAKIKENI